MRSSIFYTITFFFFLTVASIFLAFLWLMEYDKQNYTKELNSKYSIVSSATIYYLNNTHAKEDLKERFNEYKMSIVTNSSRKDTIIKNASIIQEIKHGSNISSILKYKKKHYLKISHKNSILLLKDRSFQPYRYDVIKLIFAGILFVTLFSYVLTIRKLKPLRKLKIQIDKFARGDIDEVQCTTSGKDEISEVANAFQNAVTQIKKLNGSRQLFLRNIMHELKTPITKGVITTEMLEKNKYQQRLVNVFKKLEHLINEFAMVEHISSGVIVKDYKPYRLVDLLDEAIDISMVEKDDVIIEIEKDMSLKVDFKFFSVALKNMIDNGIKYSTDKKVKIKCNHNAIHFINRGEPLTKDLRSYIEPFSKGKNAKKSFGLGLYIVDNILNQHELTLEYSHQNGYNVFSFANIQVVSKVV